MPGNPRVLIFDVLCCLECHQQLVADDCPCGFTCSIDELRRRRRAIPPVEPPGGVWVRTTGTSWRVTAYPLSGQILISWVAILLSGGFVIASRGLWLMVAVTSVFWIAGGSRVLRLVRIRGDASGAFISTAAWNLPWPYHVDWNQLRAIRPRVRSYSDGSKEHSLMLDANEIVEVGRFMGERQIQFLIWTLYRRALERR